MIKTKKLLLAGVASLALGILPANAQVGGTAGVGGAVNGAGGALGATTGAQVGGSGLNTSSAVGTSVNPSHTGAVIGTSSTTTGGTDIGVPNTHMGSTVNGAVDSTAAGAASTAGGMVHGGASTAAGAAYAGTSAMSSADLSGKLKGMGYTRIKGGASGNGNYSYTARSSSGQLTDIVVDGSTGAVVSATPH